MEQLPKIVRDRLQASAPENHPDPDLLTAFAEHSLTQRERDRVIDHLSRCSECRHILALATPEPQNVAEPMPKSAAGARVNWFRWPMLRWGALAACITVVAAAVLLRYPKTSQVKFEAQVRREQTALPAIAGDNTNRAQVPSTSVPAPAIPKPQPATAVGVLSKKGDTPVPHDNAEAGANISAIPQTAAPGLTSDLRSKPAFTANAAPAASLVPKSETSQNEGRPRILQPGMTQTVEVGSAPRPSPGEPAGMQARQQLDATSIYAQSPAVSRASSGATAEKRALAPEMNAMEWSLSDTGVPRRSFDHGNSWQEIDLGNHAAGFRALSALGSEVWVGGSGGLLYHSSDGGNQWTRVIPRANGFSLASDISQIGFVDSQHGKVTAVNGEVWVTSDGGKRWTKE